MQRTFLGAGFLLALVCSGCSSASAREIDGGTDAVIPSADSAVASDASRDTGSPPSFRMPNCETGSVPIADGRQLGSSTCTPVGASLTTPAGEWPDVTSARMPLVYVRPGATNGDGSMANPLGTIAEAVALLATRGNGTVVLSAGSHTVASTITLDGITVLGIGGPTGSIVEPPADGPAFDANPTAGSMVSIEQLTINKDTPHTGPALRALGDGSVHLRDVHIDASEVGIAVADTAGVQTALDAEAITITHATTGIVSGASNSVTLRSFLIENTRVGVKTSGSTVSAVEGAVHHFTAGGFSGDVGGVTSPSTMQLDRVTLWDGNGYGAWLGGSMLTVTASRLLVSGVHAAGGSGGAGIGLLVTKNAHLDLDVDIGSDAQQGLGSIVAANDGTGIVFDQNATATVHGAYVVGNQQSGVLVQATANVREIGYSYFTDNVGSAVAVSTGGIIAGLLCDGFVANRAGAMQFVSGAVTLQDSVVIAPQSTSYQVIVSGNLFESSARYGLFSVGIDVVLMSNTFTNNVQGAVVIGGTATGTQSNDVTDSPAGASADALPGAVMTTGAP
jgi:hypothetical protein